MKDVRRRSCKVGKNNRRYKSIQFDGHQYQINDSVLIKEWSDEEAMGKIIEIYEEQLKIMWYYKPEDVFQSRPNFFGQAELFESNHYQIIAIESIYEKIQVLPLNIYHSLEEVEHNVYFQRALYDYKTHFLTPPMKNWQKVCSCMRILNPDQEFIICDSCQGQFHSECYPEADNFKCPLCGLN